MFGQETGFGFIPSPNISLNAGNLYNVVISLLVCLACAFAGWSIYSRGKKTTQEKSFALFLALVGLYWFGSAISNSLAWFKVLAFVKHFAYLVKLKLILPPLVLGYFLAGELFRSRTSVRRLTFILSVVAAVFLWFSYRLDQSYHTVTYWGVQWQISDLPKLIYLTGLLLPLALMAVYLVVRTGRRSLETKKPSGYALYFGGIIFVLLEYLQIAAPVITWQRLLARLLYILIAFGAYLSFIGRIEVVRFIPRAQELIPKKLMRVPFFYKLLFLFILLAVIPITISSLLMFVSFKEIIDLYVHKPLLWNLKASREAFVVALNHLQIQSLFLMLLTGLLVFVVSILVSRAIAASLKTVSLGMEKVSKGDFSFKIQPDSNDELGDVAGYFNEMSIEIQRSREIMQRWNKELETKVAERTEDLRALYNVSEAIGSSLDFDLLIDQAVSKLLPVVKADTYAILIPDEQGQYITRISHGLNLNGVRLSPEQGFLAKVIKTNKVSQAQAELGLKSLLAVPLRAKGKTLGVLILGSQNEKTHFGEREINLLATISEQLAVAIENVGIYEKEKEAVARLTELDRLKNEFISMVSHELRTPVTSVDGYISLFLTGATGQLTADQKKYLTVMQENDQRLLTLINRLLDFSKIESGRFSVKKELISINDIINQAIMVISPQLGKRGLHVRLELKAHNSNFMGDRDKMIEVFINLLENALKFAQSEKKLSLIITTLDEGDFIRIEVADNGIGLEQSQLEMIFNKFFQVEDTMTRKVGGVGLGLAIVKEIIGNHNGRIWAESAGKGKGSTFIFTLPVAEKV